MEHSNSYAYGPNIIFTAKETERCTAALQKVSKEQLRRCRKVLLEGEQSLTALVVGESGTGKTILCGAEVAEVASGPTPVTREPKRYTGRVGNVDMAFVEVPDLNMDEIRSCKQQLQSYCPNDVDVVYVCQKLYDRHRPSPTEALRRLSVVFGREIHKRAVFVMTFADDVPKSWGRRVEKKKLQENLEKDWHAHTEVIRRKYQQEMHGEADKLLIMPAAYYEKGDQECSRKILNVTDDWICDLLLATIHTYFSATHEVNRCAALLNVMATQANEGNAPTSGYTATYLGGVGNMLSNLEQAVVETIYTIVGDIASSFVTVCECIKLAFNSMCRVVATALVTSAVVAAILAVILLTVVVVAVQLMVFAGVGGIAGCLVGAAIGGIVGSAVPVLGTAVGVDVGGGIGVYVGMGAGAALYTKAKLL